jgi:hypothetical protein
VRRRRTARHQHQRQEARHDEVLDRIDTEDLSTQGRRLPSTAELTAIRDDLAARVAAAETEDTQRRASVERCRLEPSDEPSVAGGRAGRQRWELALGHGRWTVPLTEG